MMKAGIDQDALITMFAAASAKQGAALRKTVSEATLRALQGRELTLENIRKVVKNVAEAASIGIARNDAPQVDVEALIEKALGGIDAALLQAVEANRKALEQFVNGGVSLTEKPLKDALANVEKMEDVFFSAVAKASQSAGPLQGPWQNALESFRSKGSATGSQAAQTVESLLGQAQTMLREGRASGMKAAQSAGPLQGPWQNALDSFRAKGSATGSQAAQTVETLLGQAQTMLRDSRATGMRAAQAMLDSYAALASGVLIGMSEGLRAGTAGASSGGARAGASDAGGSAAASDGGAHAAGGASSRSPGGEAASSRSTSGSAAKRPGSSGAKRRATSASKRSAR